MPEIEFLVKELKRYGQVFGSHVADPEISNYGETDFTSEEILIREQSKVEECEYFIAEISTPSLGVGYLLHLARTLNKKIFCLYKEENEFKISSIIKGDKNIQIYSYLNFPDLEVKIKNIFTLL
jgi:hypothetical protein